MITYGRLEGRFFSPYAIDNVMTPLAKRIEQMFNVVINVWYDDNADFYHCAFTTNGHKVDIRYYKVLSSYIDGKEGWIACPIYQCDMFLDSLKAKVA